MKRKKLEKIKVSPHVARDDFIRYAECVGDPQSRETRPDELQSLRDVFEIFNQFVGRGVERAHVGIFGVGAFRDAGDPAPKTPGALHHLRRVQKRDREIVLGWQYHAQYFEGRELEGDIFGAVIDVRSRLREFFPHQTAF